MENRLGGHSNRDSMNYWVNAVKNVKGPLILDIEHWPIYSESHHKAIHD